MKRPEAKYPLTHASSSDELIPRSIQIYSINLHEADGYIKTEYDILRQELKKLNLYDDNYLYHAFFPQRLKMVLTTGTPHRQDHPRKDWLDCMEFNDFENPALPDVDFTVYLAFAAKNSSFAVFAVYLRNKLELREVETSPEDTSLTEYHDHTYYKFKNPEQKLDALVAVVKIKDFWNR